MAFRGIIFVVSNKNNYYNSIDIIYIEKNVGLYKA